MTDHANELRRYSRKIGHPAGDVPSVMLAAADEIERLAARLEATEEDRSNFLVEMGKLCAQCDALRAKIETAENDAAHQKALADSALRVAKGWERKCGELRAKIERIDEAMESLLIRCDDSDSAMYGTLSTSFVRDTVRIARGAMEESK